MVHGKSSASVPKEKLEPLRQETRRNAIVSKEEARKGVQLCKNLTVVKQQSKLIQKKQTDYKKKKKKEKTTGGDVCM